MNNRACCHHTVESTVATCPIFPTLVRVLVYSSLSLFILISSSYACDLSKVLSFRTKVDIRIDLGVVMPWWDLSMKWIVELKGEIESCSWHLKLNHDDLQMIMSALIWKTSKLQGQQ